MPLELPATSSILPPPELMFPETLRSSAAYRLIGLFDDARPPAPTLILPKLPPAVSLAERTMPPFAWNKPVVVMLPLLVETCAAPPIVEAPRVMLSDSA